MEAVGKPRRRVARPTGAVALIERHPATPSVTVATEPPGASEELSEDQKGTYEVTTAVPDLLEPALDEQAVVIYHRPDLIPEWVPKLQWVASGAALFFAAVAIVVERHEQRYHHHLSDDEP